jgi:hypothetical protein
MAINKADIENFFWNVSEDRDQRIKLFNFIYNKTNAFLKTDEFDKVTIDWIKKNEEIWIKINELNDFFSVVNPDEIESDLKNIAKSSWLDTVNNIHRSYTNYLHFMKAKEINYLIISEAPLLNIDKGVFYSNYIFDETNLNGGSYRTAPFIAISKIADTYDKTKKDVLASDLINVFEENGVGFMDLIPLPLPTIPTDLRKEWSTNKEYYIDNIPRVVKFLEIAFEKLVNDTNCRFSSELKVALMMPPKTAMGIINFFINEKNKSLINQDLWNLRHHFIILNTNEDAQHFPDKCMRLHKSITMNGANHPCENLLENALKKLQSS